MENQVNQLKLNVTNISSYLIRSNKELKKLKTQKKDLFFKLEKKSELGEKEKRIETKGLGIGAGFSKIAGTVTAPARSLFDKILDFFGLIALGVLVQNLPAIIKKIDEFFNSDFIKAVGSIFNSIGTGFQKLGELVGFLSPAKQKEIDKDLKKFGSDIDDNIKNIDQAEKDIVDLDPELAKREKENENENKSNNQWWDFLNLVPNTSTPNTGPNIGFGSGSNTGLLGPMPKLKGYASGGTVTNDQQTKPAYTPRKSGALKQSERNMNAGFGDYAKSVDNLAYVFEKDEKNVMAFAKMSEKFREWSSVGITTGPNMPPGQNGSGGPNGGGPPPRMAMIPGNGKVRSGADITDPNDPDGQDSGMDIALLDANGTYGRGAIIQNPFSELKITDSGYQFQNGRGFGYYVTGNAVIQGKTYELLVGHLDNIAVNVGDVLNAGDSIGTQGMSGSTTGPHVTTHINDLSGGGDPWGVLNSVADSWKNGTIIQTDKTKKQNNGSFTTIPRNTKGLNTSNKGGNQSLFVYAVQPVETFVPFPYPVPIEIESSSPAPSRKKLPEIWRVG